MSIEMVTVEECKQENAKNAEVMNQPIEKKNQAFLKGFLKFCERVSKYQGQTSKLTSAFHCFAGSANTHDSKKVVNSSLLKKKLGKKIKVQPEAVKRRKVESGSKTAIQKGMRKRKNPFELQQPSVKRAHSFSHNVKNNEAASKKAGRTMTSKTKLISSCSKDSATKVEKTTTF